MGLVTNHDEAFWVKRTPGLPRTLRGASSRKSVLGQLLATRTGATFLRPLGQLPTICRDEASLPGDELVALRILVAAGPAGRSLEEFKEWEEE